MPAQDADRPTQTIYFPSLFTAAAADVPAAQAGLEQTSAALALTLAAEPPQVEPGEVLTYTVVATNTGTTALADLVLSDTLPTGLVYVQGSAVGFAFDPSEKRLTWAVPELGAGAVISGGLQARAQGVALGETIVNTVVATAAGLPTPVTAPAVVSVRLQAAARAWIGPAGGVLAALEGRVVLVFPADAVAEPVLVEITPAAEVRLEPQLIEAFRLTAQDQAGQPVTQFGRPVQVLLDLEFYDAALRTRQGSPSLYWLDEGRGEWQAVPTAVDWGRNTATATVEHFSIYAAGTSSTFTAAAATPACRARTTLTWRRSGATTG